MGRPPADQATGFKRSVLNHQTSAFGTFAEAVLLVPSVPASLLVGTLQNNNISNPTNVHVLPYDRVFFGGDVVAVGAGQTVAIIGDEILGFLAALTFQVAALTFI